MWERNDIIVTALLRTQIVYMIYLDFSVVQADLLYFLEVLEKG